MKLNNAKTFVTIHCSDLMSTLSNLNVVKCIVFNKIMVFSRFVCNYQSVKIPHNIVDTPLRKHLINW